VINNGKEIASALRNSLADRIGEDRFELWFGTDVKLEYRDGRLEVEVSDLFYLEQVRRRFMAELEAVGLQVIGKPVTLNVRVREPQSHGAPEYAASPVSDHGFDPTAESLEPPPSLDSDATANGDPLLQMEPREELRGSLEGGQLAECNPSVSSVAPVQDPVNPQSADESSAATVRPSIIRVLPCSRREPENCESSPQKETSGISVPAPFIVGEENRLAYASAEMILKHPGRTTPLFLYGPTGSGKTHLLETIRREGRRRTNLRRVVSVSAEQFTTQFLEALQGSGLPNFRRKFRQVELLLIDDLQFFLGKKTTISELQNTVDFFLRDRRQLVLAADRSPAELTGMSQELRGRISGGLVCHLVYPELETRRRIVRQFASTRGGLDDDVAEMLATRFPGDVRQLAGALNRLHAHGQAHDVSMTIERAEAALSDLLRNSQRVVRLVDIDGAVCEVFGIDRDRLHSDRKEKLVSQPRMLAMWLARKHTRAGLAEICRYFGRRSHSTVVSAQRNVNRWVSDGSAIRLASGDCTVEDAIRRVESKLRSG
jgi:chromosomal replication initiator protein